MLTVLTPSAAKELGRFLSQVQTTHRPQLTFRELAQRAEVSSQYVHNIVSGAKGSQPLTATSTDKYFAVARALCLSDGRMSDLLLRARVKSALEEHGLPLDQVSAVWNGVVAALAAQRTVLHLDVTEAIAEIIEGPPCGG